MLAFIALFLPAVVMVGSWYRFVGGEFDWRRALVGWCGAALLLNLLTAGVAYVLFDATKGVPSNLEGSPSFACKYLLMSTVLAVGLPWAWSHLRQVRVQVSGRLSFPWEGRRPRLEWLLYVYAGVLLLVNLSRCFDDVIWGDEAYSVRLAQMSFANMLSATASDVHPPLYYMLLQVFQNVFGGGWHVATVLTYAVVLVVGVTWVRREFGWGPAALFITFASFLDNAVRYNLEIRMYSMASMFVLLAFVALYYVLRDGNWWAYVLLSVFSLGAAYSHYYALLTVAFLYLFLIGYAVCRKEARLRTLVSSVIALAGYLPWMLTFLSTLGYRLTTEYWISSVPTIKSCLYYLFSGALQEPLLVAYVALIVVLLVVEGRCIKVRPSLGGKTPELSVGLGPYHVSSLSLWVLAGQVAICGTFLVGVGVSTVVRPLFLLRYLFPAVVIAWLVFVVCVSRLRWGNVIALVLAVVVAWAYAPSFAATMQTEDTCEEETAAVLAATTDVDATSYVVTDISHLKWTVLNHYYPGVHKELQTDLEVVIEELDGEETWLYWSSELDEESLAAIEARGYVAELVVSGHLGSNNYVYVYRVTEDYAVSQEVWLHVTGWGAVG